MTTHLTSVSPEAVHAWVERAKRNRLDIHFQRTDPDKSVRDLAFTRMSAALADAIEEVRVLAEAAGERAARLQRENDRLRAELDALRRTTAHRLSHA